MEHVNEAAGADLVQSLNAALAYLCDRHRFVDRAARRFQHYARALLFLRNGVKREVESPPRPTG